MEIKVTYTFKLEGTEIILTEDQARELYNELAKSFSEKKIDTAFFPKRIQDTKPWELTPSDYPYSTPVYCNSKPDQNIGC